MHNHAIIEGGGGTVAHGAVSPGVGGTGSTYTEGTAACTRAKRTTSGNRPLEG